jgi:hypothetical protein
MGYPYVGKKKKLKDLAAEAMTWLPAPEVDDAAADQKPTFWAS